MVKVDIVRAIQLETGLQFGEAEQLVNELLEIMKQTLENGEDVLYYIFKGIAEHIEFCAKNPDIAEEWHPTKNDKKPEEFTPYSNKKVWWQCQRGHEWHTPIAHRTVLGNGCAKCSNQYSKNEITIIV